MEFEAMGLELEWFWNTVEGRYKQGCRWPSIEMKGRPLGAFLIAMLDEGA
jgi:hypothetical protein